MALPTAVAACCSLLQPPQAAPPLASCLQRRQPWLLSWQQLPRGRRQGAGQRAWRPLPARRALPGPAAGRACSCGRPGPEAPLRTPAPRRRRPTAAGPLGGTGLRGTRKGQGAGGSNIRRQKEMRCAPPVWLTDKALCCGSWHVSKERAVHCRLPACLPTCQRHSDLCRLPQQRCHMQGREETAAKAAVQAQSVASSSCPCSEGLDDPGSAQHCCSKGRRQRAAG